MKYRLTALNAKSQPIENITDIVIDKIEGIEENVLFVRMKDTKKIIETNRRLMEVSLMTGIVFVFIPEDVKFFRLQEEDK